MSLPLAIASTSLLLVSCAHQDWNVFVSSDATKDVVVRVTDAGGARDVFLKAGAETVVVSLSDPLPPATIELLDPETCKILAAGDLPSEGITVGFGDGASPGELNMEIAARTQPFGGHLPPVDERCSGQ